MKTISITQDKENPLAAESDYPLRTALSKEAPLRSGATISLLMQMYTLDVLFYTYVSNYYETSLKNIELSKQVIQELNLTDRAQQDENSHRSFKIKKVEKRGKNDKRNS